MREFCGASGFLVAAFSRNCAHVVGCFSAPPTLAAPPLKAMKAGVSGAAAAGVGVNVLVDSIAQSRCSRRT
jgi:hypothetical protein